MLEEGETARGNRCLGVKMEKNRSGKKKNARPILEPVNRNIKTRRLLDYSRTHSCSFPFRVVFFFIQFYLHILKKIIICPLWGWSSWLCGHLRANHAIPKVEQSLCSGEHVALDERWIRGNGRDRSVKTHKPWGFKFATDAMACHRIWGRLWRLSWRSLKTQNSHMEGEKERRKQRTSEKFLLRNCYCGKQQQKKRNMPMSVLCWQKYTVCVLHYYDVRNPKHVVRDQKSEDGFKPDIAFT